MPKKLPQAHPYAPGGFGDAPNYLQGVALDVWHMTVEALDADGLGSQAERPTLEAYCLAVSQMRQAMADIAEHGALVYDAQHTLKRNPASLTLNASTAAVGRLSKILGLNPGTRHLLRTTPKAEANEFDEI